ncbi:MAG: hypothetical protein O3A14_16710 [Cyanobacteria bacterium]|nr:hypothetical protein [Cyanobacteriota bacterium]
MAINFAACQSLQPSVDTSTEVTGSPVDDSTAAVEEDLAKQVFPNDFEQVCNGIAFAPAKAYEPTAGSIHHLYVFDRESDSETFSESYRELPSSWKMEWEESQETQLVACLTVTKQAIANACEFDPDEGQTQGYVLETYDTTYDVALYAAQSGELIDSTTFDLSGDDCPVVHFFTEGEYTDSSSANYTQALIDFVKPYVQPES